MEIKFYPGAIQAKKINVGIKTAGSIGLALQPLMIPAAFSNGRVFVEFDGGATDGPLAPPIDFLKKVTLPVLCKMGYRGEVECLQRGHYPRGGGMVRVRIDPAEKLQAIGLTEQGKIMKISGIAHAVRLPATVATRIAHAAAKELIKNVSASVDIKSESYQPNQDPHLGPGAGITIWAETESGAILGASSLGRPGKPAEEVGREAADSLIQQLKTGAAVDLHLADQLIPYLALAAGTSRITAASLTSHALTNVELVEKILGTKFEVRGEIGKPGSITVTGLDFRSDKSANINKLR